MPFANEHPLDERSLCAVCRGGKTPFDAAYFYGGYDGALRELILLFKYGRVQALAPPLGRLLRLSVPSTAQFDLVVPMPLHWRRRWWRGFNQAALLAREFSRHTAVPMVRAARRRRSTAVQASLGPSARRRNVAGAFEVRRPETLSGKNVLLVDDVMTTGATAAACANALKRAGARSVSIVVLARAGRWTHSESLDPVEALIEPPAGGPESLSSLSRALAEDSSHSNLRLTRSLEDAQPGSPA